MKQFAIIILSLFVFSCQSNNENQKDAQKSSDVQKKEVVEEQPELISTTDNQKEVDRKLTKMCQMTGAKLERDTLSSNFYNDDVINYIMTPPNNKASELEVLVANDEFRFMKMLLQHVGDTSEVNQKKFYQGIQSTLVQGLNSGGLTIVDDQYMKFEDQGETWYAIWYLEEDKKSGEQDYYNIMVPEKDFAYLRYEASQLKSNREKEIELLIKL